MIIDLLLDMVQMSSQPEQTAGYCIMCTISTQHWKPVSQSYIINVQREDLTCNNCGFDTLSMPLIEKGPCDFVSTIHASLHQGVLIGTWSLCICDCIMLYVNEIEDSFRLA